MKKIRAPFAWIGGKSKLADDIVEMMPEHRLYVEVFGGALNVLYRKPLTKGKNAEVVNDINGELINLHRVIKSSPQSLSKYLNHMLISREIFYDIVKGRIKPKNNIERAAYYYYSLTQSFGAKGTTFAMNAKSRRPKNIYRSFFTWSQRLKFVTIENKSFADLIKTYDKEENLDKYVVKAVYKDEENVYKDIAHWVAVKKHEEFVGITDESEDKKWVAYTTQASENKTVENAMREILASEQQIWIMMKDQVLEAINKTGKMFEEANIEMKPRIPFYVLVLDQLV